MSSESDLPRGPVGPLREPPIDLRSDTVTRPDEEMRRAMANAEVGDDVYGEDPTVAALEEAAAAAVGHEAALFVPSGTMGNQIALRIQGASGQEVICDARSHMVVLEMGAMSALSGLVPRTLDSPQGLLDPAAVAAAVSPGAGYRSRTCLLAVENSHNLAGGSVYDRPHLEALLAVAGGHGLPAHLDGARIFNAAVALGTSAAALAAGFSSTMFCLSKGLGAPVGSLLCGSRDLVREGRRVRKMFGGGMRQAGVLAAAGLVALRQGPARLAADHANARLLAAAVAELPGVEIDPAAVRTNIVVFRVTTRLLARVSQADSSRGAANEPGSKAREGRKPEAYSQYVEGVRSSATPETGAFPGPQQNRSEKRGQGGAPPPEGLAAAVLARLRAAGVLATQVSHDQVRMVTHRDAPRPRIEQAIERLRQALAPAGVGS